MSKLIVRQPVAEFSTFTKTVVPDEVISSGKPTVMRDFVNNWPVVACAQHSEARLREYLDIFDAKLPLTAYISDYNNAIISYKSDFSGFNFKRDQSTLQEVMNELLNDGNERTYYIGSTQIDRWLPGFRKENDVRLTDIKPMVNFWLGNQNQIAAHYDCPANIACCVAGERSFILFPPEQVSNLYIGPLDVNPSGRAISLVNFDDPDYQKFPKFKIALNNAQSVKLKPGDALFIPPLWWHHVRSHNRLNMLVNYWWKSSPKYMGNPELALEHAILALRGLEPQQKQAWKALFEHYVFSESHDVTAHIPEHIQGILKNNDEQAIRRGWLNFSKKLNS
jgi:hypothetical protein